MKNFSILFLMLVSLSYVNAVTSIKSFKISPHHGGHTEKTQDILNIAEKITKGVKCRGCVDACIWRLWCKICWKPNCSTSGCSCKPVSGGCHFSLGCPSGR